MTRIARLRAQSSLVVVCAAMALGELPFGAAAWAAALAPADRAVQLCGATDCSSALITGVGGRVRLTVSVDDARALTIVSATSRRDAAQAVYENEAACALCSPAAEADILSASALVSSLLWQRARPDLEAAAREVFEAPEGAQAVISRVYLSNLIILDHSDDDSPSLFQVDVRVGFLP